VFRDRRGLLATFSELNEFSFSALLVVCASKLSSRELAEDEEVELAAEDALLDRSRTRLGLIFFLAGGTGGSSCLGRTDLRMPLPGGETGGEVRPLGLTEVVISCCCC